MLEKKYSVTKEENPILPSFQSLLPALDFDFALDRGEKTPVVAYPPYTGDAMSDGVGE